MPVSTGLRDVREPHASFELDMKAPHPIQAILESVRICIVLFINPYLSFGVVLRGFLFCRFLPGGFLSLCCRVPLRQAPKTQWSEKLKGAQKIYGSAFASSMEMDRCILKQFQRGPGLVSSFSGLDTFMGRDETIGFEDYLGGACLLSWLVLCRGFGSCLCASVTVSCFGVI